MTDILDDFRRFADEIWRFYGISGSAGLSFDVATNPDRSGKSSANSLIVAGQLMSTAKVQAAGLSNAVDTEDCVVGWLQQMQAEGYLPK